MASESSSPINNRIAETPTEPVQLEFTVMNYNVNRFWLCDNPEEMKKRSENVAGWSDEQLSIFHWNNRANRIAKSIVANDADFVALEELRKMDTSSVYTMLSQPGIEERYRFIEWIGNGTPLCMSFGLLYDYRRWFLCGQDRVWLSDTPQEPSDFDEKGFGRVLGYADFFPINQENQKIQMMGEPLRVYVTHLAVFPESLKHQQVEALAGEIYDEISSFKSTDTENHPEDNIILMGDFNFFDDCEGGQMREHLEKYFQNVGKDAVYSQSGKKAERTFVPYAYDPMFAKLQNTCSVLDHIFTTPKIIEKVGDSWLDTKTYCDGREPEELSDWNALPSDHMPLCARIKLSFQPKSYQ